MFGTWVIMQVKLQVGTEQRSQHPSMRSGGLARLHLEGRSGPVFIKLVLLMVMCGCNVFIQQVLTFNCNMLSQIFCVVILL